MDAEKLALKRRIDTLDQHANRLHAALAEHERENARLKAEMETVKNHLEENRKFRIHFSELSWKYRKELGRMKRERDAALVDLKKRRDCKVCKYYVRQAFEEPCVSCGFGQRNWEWRGLCESNGGIE